MAFADEKSFRDRSAGIGGVVIVHAGLAALLIVGLTTEVTQEIFSGPLPAKEYRDPPPPPPPDKPKPEPKTESTAPPVYVPPAPSPLPPKPSFIKTTSELPPISDTVVLKNLPDVPVGPIVPEPPVIPLAKPVAATPRNNAGSWVTDNDYKSRWIREGMMGTASFRLQIAANGRVSDCRITKSTGYDQLDAATCALIAKRARFNPASNAAGEKTAGTYSSSIRWVVPE